MKIRPADRSEAALVSEIIRKAFRDVAERFHLTPENCPKHPSNCTRAWIERDLTRGVMFFLLEQDSAPVGCVGVEQAGPDVCYLERLSVLPAHRRKGYGRALVDRVFSRARSLGAARIGIGIIAADAALKQWYQEIGFIEGETKSFEHLPFQVTFMAYELAASAAQASTGSESSDRHLADKPHRS